MSASVGVVGAGITGAMIALRCLEKGFAVTLFDKSAPMSETSSSSSKLLHGGLRYLEQGHLTLVRNALRDRSFFLERYQNCRPLKFIVPVYASSSRTSLKIKIGLILYQILAGKYALGRSGRLDDCEIEEPLLRAENSSRFYYYWDAQMTDDLALGKEIIQDCLSRGLQLQTPVEVERISTEGLLTAAGRAHSFDVLVNAAGPWAAQLLKNSGISSSISLRLVRGSHIILDRKVNNAWILEVPNSQRIFFVLPYGESDQYTLVGTTEVPQHLEQSVKPSSSEIQYLIDSYNSYFEPITFEDVVGTQAGLRPIIDSGSVKVSESSRGHEIVRRDKLISVFGGKWTSSPTMSREVRAEIERCIK